ncbi:Hypothetical protein A7982_01310 [Minicystis rosea]|nr:Hypothetical protein A7982_01310 [Minicystis rosea]
MVLAVGIAGMLLAPAAARADSPKNDPVAAQALFKAARERIQAGDYAGGCPKFEASFALQPSASTMINIAKCHEHDGKIASAWDDYQRALTLNRETKGNDRRKELESLAKKGIEAIEPRLPRLRIVMKSPPPGLKVLRDGSEIPAAALGEALPVDPGAHEIVASAPGHAEQKRSVTVAEGKSDTIEITLSAAPTAESPASNSKVPTWAWIVGAAGLGLTGAGVFFLVDNSAAIHALRSQCRDVPGGVYCPPGYDYASDNARKNRDLPLAIALGGAGLVAMGVAIGGIVTGVAKKPAPAAGMTFVPWFAPGGAGAVLSGRF